MFIKKSNARLCAYCKYFNCFEYSERNRIIQKGVCVKHDLIRELYDELCEDFVLRKGVYTDNLYPNKKEI